MQYNIVLYIAGSEINLLFLLILWRVSQVAQKNSGKREVRRVVQQTRFFKCSNLLLR